MKNVLALLTIVSTVFLPLGLVAAEAGTDDLTRLLYDAVSANDLEEAKRLIEQGAEVNKILSVTYPWGLTERLSTPLFEAIDKANVAMVNLLLEKGADPNMQPNSGDFPLNKIARRFNRSNPTQRAKDLTTIAGLLLKRGARVNQQDDTGFTPLMEVAALAEPNKNDIAFINLLLRHGADPLMKNKSGYGALDYVQNDQFRKVIQDEFEKRDEDLIEGIRALPVDLWKHVLFEFVKETNDQG